MEASFLREAGKSFMSDEEYEELKQKLKVTKAPSLYGHIVLSVLTESLSFSSQRQGSKVAAEGPRCSLRDRKVPWRRCLVLALFLWSNCIE